MRYIGENSLPKLITLIKTAISNYLPKPTNTGSVGQVLKLGSNNTTQWGTLTASNVGAVPTTRTVNGKALSSNIALSASDVSAQEKITVDGILQSNGTGAISAAETLDAEVVEIPIGILKGTADGLEAAVAGTDYITSDALEPYAKTAAIPTKTSALTNDSDYTTKTYVDSAIKSAIGDAMEASY